MRLPTYGCRPHTRPLGSAGPTLGRAHRLKLWTACGWSGTPCNDCSPLRHMMPVGTHLSGVYPQMGALIHTFGGLIHTRHVARKAGFRGSQRGTGLVRVEHLADGSDVTPEIVVLGHLALDLFAAVEHRRMVAATKRLADAQERRLGLLAHQVHRDLPREDDLLVPRFPAQLLGRHAVVARHDLDD